MKASKSTPPVKNTRRRGRASASTATPTRSARNTTSGGMNPMARMTWTVINASTSVAIGMSHIAVLLGPEATAVCAPASSDRSSDIVPSIAM